MLELSVNREQLTIGDAVTISFTLRLSDNQQPCDAVIDYRAHYSGARRPKPPKVFKLTRRRLGPRQPVRISRQQRFGHVSIRQIHPGRHTIDVQVNGAVLGSIDVDVV